MHFKDLSINLPITTTARQIAEQFSAQQMPTEKADQVRLNTLAVWVVHDYLAMMGIPCNLEASDSWNPVVRACANVADLEVAGSGHLECRPIKTGATACYFPPEVWVDRIGYLVVEISEDLRQAKLLGFTPTAATAYLPVSQLKPLESLLAHLSEFSLPQTSASEETWNRLGQWFNHVFADGWQAVDALLGGAEPTVAFRRAVAIDPQIIEGQVQRAKLVSLSPEFPVVLVVDCKPGDDQRLFSVQVHPLASKAYLPINLCLSVLDEEAQPLLEAKSRHADDYMQLQFSGSPGERFSVTVALGEASVIERFIV